jgi:phosphoribosylaminoimidazole-succinocarboxamide synthase
MGSVKDIIELPENINLRKEYKVFLTSKRFSVFDLKEYLKDKIPLKDEALCMQAANAFEILESYRIKTHYVGLLNENNEIVRIKDLKKPSNRLVFKVFNFFDDKITYNKNNGTYDYSFFEENRGKLNNFVILLEWVFRNGAPEGSSLFRKTIPKWLENKDEKNIKRFLKRTGLTQLPKPGTMFKNPIYDLWTKAEREDRLVGDDLDYEEAGRISGLTKEQFLEVWNEDKKATKILTEHLKSVGIDGYDGKKEWAWSNGPVLVDFACTADEDRWLRNGNQISKEFLRQYMEKKMPEFYNYLNQCKAKANELKIEDFRKLLWMETPRYPKHVLRLAGETYATAADVVMRNSMFRNLYGIKDLDDYIIEINKVEKELRAVKQ